MTQLQSEQEIKIDTAIDHLLTFSTSPEELNNELNTLQQALFLGLAEDKLSDEEIITFKDNPFYWLSKCFNQPARFFPEWGLTQDESDDYAFSPEDWPTPPLMLIDVKEYIFNKIHTAVTNAANAANLSCADLDWDDKQLLDDLIDPLEDNTPLIKEKAPVEAHEDVWTLPPLEGKIYNRELLIKGDLIKVDQYTYFDGDIYVNTIVSCADDYGKIKKIHVQEYPQLSDNPTTQRHTQEAVYKKADKIAEDYAIDVISDYLKKKCHDSIENSSVRYSRKLYKLYDDFSKIAVDISTDQKRIEQRAIARAVMLDNYCFNKIIDNPDKFYHYLDCSLNEASNLTDLNVQELIIKDICTEEQAKKLTSASLKILAHPFYKSLLLKNELAIETLLAIKNELNVIEVPTRVINKQTGKEEIKTENKIQCTDDYLLTYSFVVHLIATKKLSIDTALKIPRELRPLVTFRYDTEWFAGKEINWPLFCKLKAYHVPLLEKKSFSSLLKNRTIPFTDLLQVSEAIAKFMLDCPYLIDWLNVKLFTLAQLNTTYKQNTWKDFYSDIYANRLHAIFCGHPYKIADKVDNNILILKEIPQIAHILHQSPNDIEYDILKKMVQYLFMTCTEKSKLHPDKKNVFSTLLQTLSDGKKTDIYTLLFEKFVAIAQTHQEKHRRDSYLHPIPFITNYLFDSPPVKRRKPDDSTDSEERAFCENIIAFTTDYLYLNQKQSVLSARYH